MPSCKILHGEEVIIKKEKKKQRECLANDQSFYFIM